MLTAAGWAVHDYEAFNSSASTGIAFREVPLNLGHCDYLLLMNNKPAGGAEAKKEGMIPHLAEQTRLLAEVERRLSVVEELETVFTTNLKRATHLR